MSNSPDPCRFREVSCFHTDAAFPLVFPSDGLVADVGSARDQKPNEFYTKYVLTRCLVIGHLVKHVAPVARTFNSRVPPFIGVSLFAPLLSLFLLLLVKQRSAIPLVSE